MKLTRDDLATKRVWVLLRYPDGSEFSFQTTLNPELLRQLGVQLLPGTLVRLDKKYYINGQMVYKSFPYAGATISVWDEETYTDPKSQELSKYL